MPSVDEIIARMIQATGAKNQQEMLVVAGLATGLASNWKRRGKVPEKSIARVAEVTGVSFAWLNSGEGERFVAKEPALPPEARLPKQIPVLGKVPAGFPNMVQEEVLEYISLPDAPSDAFALIIKGESMSPAIRDGDYILFIPNGEFKNGDVVVINDEWGDTVCKRYREKDGKPYLVSDNPEYPTLVPNENYRLIGRVVRAWREVKF